MVQENVISIEGNEDALKMEWIGCIVICVHKNLCFEKKSSERSQSSIRARRTMRFSWLNNVPMFEI